MTPSSVRTVYNIYISASEAFIKIAGVPSFASTRRHLFLQVTTWDIGEIIEQAPAREKMAARRDLRKWLQTRGQDIARFDALAKRKDGPCALGGDIVGIFDGSAMELISDI
jgi:hypothetical protein